ncbi:MAG TPA: GNAT family protein [Chryseosolibacter sp.]
MQLNHRLAQERDLQPVFELYMEPSANAFLTFDPMSIQDFDPTFKSMLADKNLYVSESAEKVIATYRLIQKAHRQSHILYLGGFTIDKSYKGRGLGFQILEHIKKEAQSRQMKRVELTVDTENVIAINLYRKIGFEIEGKLKNNYRLATTGKYYDEYLMALLLQ